jgi:CubicO group peptidase (beta-lactamase class C family)
MKSLPFAFLFMAAFAFANPNYPVPRFTASDRVTQLETAFPKGTRYEYSNFAFALLGRVVAKAAGEHYEKYVRREILNKLHMDSTVYEFSQVPKGMRAIGYRLRPDGIYQEEPPLPHGVFGATGGLVTDAGDMGKYLAFHLAAWPARDDADQGPVRRSSLREMSHLWTPANLSAKRADGKLRAVMGGYGYGLRIFSDCRFEHIVAHGGGLPGFGSYMAWLPDYGIGMFAMATLTYSGPAEAMNSAWDAFLKTGGLRPRQLPASPPLLEARVRILNLWKAWDDAQARSMAAMNLLIDAPAAQRREQIRTLKAEVGGECTAGPLSSENWLRGQFNLSCPSGTVGVFFTMSPTRPPAVQHLEFRKLDSEAILMAAPTGAPAGVSCSD